uniref:Uncharacterized protein n=1 Tax=Anguilla anguilla TaxID=7936 RepID=A0A0E9P7G6_ANGAN
MLSCIDGGHWVDETSLQIGIPRVKSEKETG